MFRFREPCRAREDAVEQIRDDGRVIGAVTYIGRDDVWRAESIHQPGTPRTFHDPEDAQQWVRRLHAEETDGQPD